MINGLFETKLGWDGTPEPLKSGDYFNCKKSGEVAHEPVAGPATALYNDIDFQQAHVLAFPSPGPLHPGYPGVFVVLSLT
jgi:hypothetical protein